MEPKGSPIQPSISHWTPQISSIEAALSKLQKIEELSSSWAYNISSLKSLKSELESLSNFYSFLKTSQNIVSSPELGYFCALPPEIILFIMSLLDYVGLSRICLVSQYFNDAASSEFLWQQISEKTLPQLECVLPRDKTWRWLIQSKMHIFKEEEVKNGVGTYIWPCKGPANKHENRYCGEWLENQRHGYGTYYWCNGSLYDGDWVYDKRDGYGIRTWPNGNKYQGEYSAHKRHGEGEFTFSNGSVFKGTFRENQFVKGTYKWPNGRIYNGEWNNIFRHGHGSYSWPDGRTYIGGWKNDKRHGQGTYRWQDADVFEGTFEEGKRVGKGTLRTSDGKLYDQTWKEDKFEEFNKGLDSSLVTSVLVEPKTKEKEKEKEKEKSKMTKKRERQNLDRGESDVSVTRVEEADHASDGDTVKSPKQKGGITKQQKI